RVTEGQRGREQIAEHPEAPAFTPAEAPADQRRARHAAVEHQAALPDGEDAPAVGEHRSRRTRRAAALKADARELAGADEAVDDPRRDQPRDDHPERGVQHAAPVQSLAASLPVGEGDARRQADRDQDSIADARELPSAEPQRPQSWKHRYPFAGAFDSAFRAAREERIMSSTISPTPTHSAASATLKAGHSWTPTFQTMKSVTFP